VGGGFARYSVDGRWLVPHFEKMLYDNAQLACVYLLAFQATGDASYAAVARGTLDYLHERMVDPSGGVHSSEDADSEGEEGKFYAFTPGDIHEALGPDAGPRFCAAFGITGEGNFEHGTSVVHRFSRPAGLVMEASEERELLQRLKAWRDRRARPAKDDKVLASWNGMALSAFARGAQVLEDPRDLQAARRLGAFLRDELWREGRLMRVWRGGQAHTPGFLEDYAAVANGLVDLYETDFDPAWLRFAEQLADGLRARFEDEVEGGFFSTEAGQADLLFRQKAVQDNAIPSGNSLAVMALLRLARHLDREDLRASAERALRCTGRLLARAPRAFLALACALDFSRAPELDVVIAGDPSEDEECRLLLREIHHRFLPTRVLSCGLDLELPLHRGRGKADGKATAYVCRNHACDLPATSQDALVARLSMG
jgi:hypothetical protein